MPPEGRLEQPFDLLEYARLIAGRWRTLAVGLAVGLLAATGYILTAERLYRVAMTLVVVPARPDAVDPSRDDSPLAARFRPFVTNADVIARAVAASGLNASAPGTTPQDVAQHLTTALAPPAPVIRVTLEFPEPVAGKRLMDAIATAASELARRTLSENDAKTREYLKGQLDGAAASLYRADQELLDFRKRTAIALRRAELDSRLKQQARLQQMLDEETLREVELSTRTDALAQSLKSEPRAQLSLQLSRERAELAGVSAARERLETQVRTLRRSLGTLSDELANADLGDARLELQVTRSRATYGTLFEQYERERMNLNTFPTELRVFESPDASTYPVRPRWGSTLAFGGALGLACGLILALAIVLFSEHTGSRTFGRKDGSKPAAL